MRGLGLEPVSTAAATKAALTAAVKARIVSRFSEGIRGVFGDTPKDRERKAQAVSALQRALDGDASGLSYLLARAGIRADGVTTAAPTSARFPFRRALRDYYIATNTLPDDDIRMTIWAKVSDMPASLQNQLAARQNMAGGLDNGSPILAPVQAGVGNVSPLAVVLIATAVGFAFLRRKQ